jgi:hypothetical protein
MKFYSGNCLNGLGIVMKEPHAILFKNNAFFKNKDFYHIPGKFFHYEPLSMNFSRKNLIILEAGKQIP